MQKRDKAITVAVIGGLFVIIAALISTFGPTWWRSVLTPRQQLVIAGTVVDEASNLAIGQATISLSGRTETYLTDDNGNFRIEIRGLNGDGQPVRIHVTKDSYRPFDEAITPSAENLIVPLRKL